MERFADLQDGNRIYEAGEIYPRPDFDVSKERLAELAGSDNRIGKPIIKYIPDENKKPKTKGGKNADRVVHGAKELVRDR